MGAVEVAVVVAVAVVEAEVDEAVTGMDDYDYFCSPGRGVQINWENPGTPTIRPYNPTD